jgi:molecular chaperone HscC
MEVRASAGDNALGGEDIVHALCDLFCERNALPASQRSDAAFMQRLTAEAEAAKRRLSVAPTAEMRARIGTTDLQLTIDEALLEKVCAPLLLRLREPVERTLRDANLRTGELDAIVLAGGATRMPIVRRLVTTMFGRFPTIDLHPDEVVALGAAVQAGLKAKDAALDEVVMTDVAPYSLGVSVTRLLDERTQSTGHFDPIIERNTTVPVSRMKQYVPIREGQEMLELEIYQGESRMVRDNIHLGTLKVGLPRAPQHECAVDVRFTYDVNGLLQVEAAVAKTGETSVLVIQGNPGLMSDQEIATRLRALADLKIHPRDRLENRTVMARGERLYTQLRETEREWLGHHLTRFEHIVAAQDPRAIAAARKDLEAALARVERHDLFDGDGRS